MRKKAIITGPIYLFHLSLLDYLSDDSEICIEEIYR